MFCIEELDVAYRAPAVRIETGRAARRFRTIEPDVSGPAVTVL
jgi:hypothetical protein